MPKTNQPDHTEKLEKLVAIFKDENDFLDKVSNDFGEFHEDNTVSFKRGLIEEYLTQERQRLLEEVEKIIEREIERFPLLIGEIKDKLKELK